MVSIHWRGEISAHSLALNRPSVAPNPGAPVGGVPPDPAGIRPFSVTIVPIWTGRLYGDWCPELALEVLAAKLVDCTGAASCPCC
jgi:hypothetical protein